MRTIGYIIYCPNDKGEGNGQLIVSDTPQELWDQQLECNIHCGPGHYILELVKE